MVALSNAHQSNMWVEPIQVSYGDIWQLGKHRLMCGDATSVNDVRRLFDGSQFSLCFTSPMYTDQRTYKLGSFNWHEYMCGSFDQMIANGTPDCHILINLGLSHKNRQVDMYWLEWLMYCASLQWPVFGWYVWDKGSGMPGDNRGRLMDCHEWVFHFNKQRNLANKWIPTIEGSTPRLNGRFRQVDGTLRRENSSEKFGQPYKTPESVIRIRPAITTHKLEANH